MNDRVAFIFDLNGTMVNDMKFHTRAWFNMLNDKLGKSMNWDEVQKNMYGKNGEVLDRIFGPGHFSAEEADRIARDKEEKYREAFKPHLALLAGLQQFLDDASAHGVKLAIGSAAIPGNIDFILDNLHIRHYFHAIVSAEDVRYSKPDPETFLKAADQLETAPSSCIVFEDAPKGVEAAINAGMLCVVVTTMHNREEFVESPSILGFIKDYNDPLCAELVQKDVSPVTRT